MQSATVEKEPLHNFFLILLLQFLARRFLGGPLFTLFTPYGLFSGFVVGV